MSRDNSKGYGELMNIKEYRNIDFDDGIVTLKPLKLSFRWNPGKDFVKINQVEIDSKKFMISATFKNEEIGKKEEYSNVLGIDLNCGSGKCKFEIFLTDFLAFHPKDHGILYLQDSKSATQLLPVPLFLATA